MSVARVSLNFSVEHRERVDAGAVRATPETETVKHDAAELACLRQPYIAVVGAGTATRCPAAVAEETGRLLAEAGAVVVTGGLRRRDGGRLAGAHEAGGTTLGILPGATARRRTRS